MNVYCREGLKLACYQAGTTEPEKAREAVNAHMVAAYGSVRLSDKRWSHGPVLAVIDGGKTIRAREIASMATIRK